MTNQVILAKGSRLNRGFGEHELELLLDLAKGKMAPPIEKAVTGSIPTCQAAPVAVPAPVTLPTERNDIFRLYTAYQQSIRVAADQQNETERQLFGFSVTSTPGTLDILELATQLIDLLIRQAEQQFANRYTRLNIDRCEVLRNTGNERWRSNYEDARRANDSRRRNSVPVPLPAVPVDLEAIWVYLEKTYGGQAGERSLHKQLAPLLAKRLNLNDEGIKRTSSAVVAWIRVHTEPARWGSKTGPYKLCDRTYVNEVFDGLSRAFAWLGMDELSVALAPDTHKIGDFNFTFQSREKFSFPGIDVVAYKDSFDVKFAHDVAAKLQLYLGEFTD